LTISTNMQIVSKKQFKTILLENNQIY